MRDLVSIKTQIAKDCNPQGRKSNQKLISCVTPPSITVRHQLYDPRFSCLTVCINKKVTCALKTKNCRGKMDELKAWSAATTGRQRMIGSRRNISGRNISLKSLTGREREYQSFCCRRCFQQCNPQSLAFVLLVVLLYCVTQHAFV